MLKNILQLKKTNFRFLILGSEGLLGTEFKKLIKKNIDFVFPENILT